MGRFHAWRATLRIARRDAARAKGRSALVAVMVALPVFAASGVSVVARSSQLEPRDVVAVELGEVVQARISPSTSAGRPIVQDVLGRNSGEVPALSGTPVEPSSGQNALSPMRDDLLPAGSRVVPQFVSYVPGGVRLGDRSISVQFMEFAYDDPAVRGLITQTSGRAPAADNEVVVSEMLAGRGGLQPGAQVTLRGVAGSQQPTVKTVVGIVDAPQQGDLVISDLGGLMAPGAIDPYQNAPVYYVSGASLTWRDVLRLNAVGLSVFSRAVALDPPPSSDVPCLATDVCSQGSVASATTVAVVGVAVGMVLLQVALLAGPALAVGARRNQRTLALVASAGGERRHLRSIVLAHAVVIGLVGSAVAALAGVIVGALAVVGLRRWQHEILPRIDVHLLDLAGLVLVGALTAGAAALVPARAAARLDVVAALTGRRGQAAPRLRVPLVGLVVAAIGIALGLYGASHHRVIVLVAGIALGELGLVAAVGAVVSLAARASFVLPLTTRMALRDAARQRGRTAPAVAAVMAAVAGSVAGLLYVNAQADHDERSYQPATVLGGVVVDSGYQPGQIQPYAEVAAQVEQAVRTRLPVRDLAPLRHAVDPRAVDPTSTFVEALIPAERQCPEFTPDPVTLEITAAQQAAFSADERCTSRVDGRSSQGTSLSVDDGSALRIVTGDADPAAVAALRAGKVVVFDPYQIWPDGTAHLKTSYGDANGESIESATKVVPAFLSTKGPWMYQPVLPITVATSMGLRVEATGLVASTTRMPTETEQEQAVAAVQDVRGVDYVSIERGYQDEYALGLLALLVASAVVTLGGTFTAVGLAAAEGRADVATLAAVGASPGVRRRLVASQAGTIAVLGVALGLAAGAFAGYALIRLEQPATGASLFGGGGGWSDSSDSSGWSFVVPWWHLAGVAFVVPLLAIVTAFVSVRSRLPITRRLGQ